MIITKAVVTAASRRQRHLPLQVLIDSDGREKTLLTIIIEEALAAGIEELCVVVCPGDEALYAGAAGAYTGRLTVTAQPEPLGYGHAIWCARDFTGDEPFLHLVGDHLYVSESPTRCAQDLVRLAAAQECAVSAVQPTRENLLPYYGCVGGKRVSGLANVYQVEKVLEKPTPTEAEHWLMVPGLRTGHYLCYFGLHVLTPTLMDILGERVAAAQGGSVGLSEALDVLACRERYLAAESQGRRYDVGVRYGSLRAQVALALAGRDREDVLASLLELMVQRELSRREEA